MEFREFPKIVRLESSVTITEKIHGTNAQILITPGNPTFGANVSATMVNDEPFMILAGSRTRWLTPDDDNFGFARWVEENSAELIEKLGPGRHYGEWYGLGINSGYGLKEKRFALFDQRFIDKPLPNRVDVVPVLFSGSWSPQCVEITMELLKRNGSSLAPGFMKPEGVVVRFEANGATFKQVFEAEETGWRGAKRERVAKPDPVDVSPFLQPIRLEKLLSSDERLQREYPASLPSIAKAYVSDMEAEGQYSGLDESVLKAVKRGVFPWIKTVMRERGYAA